MIGRSELSMLDATGIDFFAIDRAMSFKEHADVLLMAGNAPIASIEDMTRWSELANRGFAIRDVDGVPVWHRFADDAWVFQLTDEAADADPFDGDGMRAARLAVLQDTVIFTRNWPNLEHVLAIRSGTGEASPTVPVLERMIAAALKVDGVGDRVLQAWATPVSSLKPMGGIEQMLSAPYDSGGEPPDPEELAGMMDVTRPIGEPLPAYPLALFVDLQAGPDQVNAIVLPYAERAQAETAAEVLADRLCAWAVPGLSDQSPAVDSVGGRVETLVVDAPDVATDLAFAYIALGAEPARPLTVDEIREQTEGIDGAIAVVAVRYPMPEDAGEGLAPTAGRLMRTWLNSIISRDFTVLSVP